jgi:hypothetical protein
MEIARGIARAATASFPPKLFQRGVDRRELGVQPGAKAVHDRKSAGIPLACRQEFLTKFPEQ